MDLFKAIRPNTIDFYLFPFQQKLWLKYFQSTSKFLLFAWIDIKHCKRFNLDGSLWAPRQSSGNDSLVTQTHDMIYNLSHGTSQDL